MLDDTAMKGATTDLREEIANSITHGVGLALAIAGAAALITLAALRHSGASVLVGVSVYAATLVLLYAISTVYHAVPHVKAKRVLRRLDHCGIYLLIAGTYTPFTLVTLRGEWGWTLLGLVWCCGVVGVVWKVFFFDRLPVVATGLYVVMGWLAVIAIKPMYEALHASGVAWIVAGGLFYTLGIVFFASQRRYAHAVWHIMVLAGSVCHYVAVMRYVLPR